MILDQIQSPADIKSLSIDELNLLTEEIKVFLTDRYGEYILFKPYFNSKNLLLWLFPFILVIGSMVIFMRNLRKK